jgi:SAM-dependent methyltransferase
MARPFPVKSVLKRLRGDGLVRQLAGAQSRQLAALDARLERIEKRLDVAAKVPAELRTSIDRAEWATSAQEGELGFHKRHNFRADEQVWRAAVETDWQAAGFSPEGWEDKFIIDVGAGSRLRTLYFKGAKIAALEPLAERYMEEVEWHDLDRAAEVYPVPGEEFVPELEGRADLIVSINALDHGYDFAQSVRNIRRYLKPQGLAFLSFDMHDEPDYMHPLLLTDEGVKKIYESEGFVIEKTEPARRYHGTNGLGAFHYWLRPA